MSHLKNFNYDLRGDESHRKLVFLHGLMGSWTNWRRIFPAFENTYQVLSLDQRGHGKSFKPETGYSPEDYAEDLRKILDELGWQKINLVGHSMGGRNALVFASQYPERVEKLVIEDIAPESDFESAKKIEDILDKVPTPFTDKRVAKETIDREFAGRTVLAGYLYSNIAEYGSGNYDWRFSKKGVLQSVWQGREVERWKEWESLSVPTLLVRGSRSDELEAQTYEKMLATNPKVKGVVIENAGHWVHFDQPQVFVDTVKSFLD